LRAMASWRRRTVSSFANFDIPGLRNWEVVEVKKLLSNQQANVFAVIDQEHRPLGLFSREQAEIFLVHSQIPELTEPLCVQPNQTMEEIEPLLEKAPYSTLLLVNRMSMLLGMISKGEAQLSQENEDRLANS